MVLSKTFFFSDFSDEVLDTLLQGILIHEAQVALGQRVVKLVGQIESARLQFDLSFQKQRQTRRANLPLLSFVQSIRLPVSEF